MPIIPRNKESTQMNPRNPVPIAGTTDARISGESLSGVGRTVAQFGDQIKTEVRRQEQFQRQNDINEGKNELQNIYKVAADHAMRTSSPDGSDLEKNFNEKAMPEADKILGRYVQDDEAYRDMRSFGVQLKSDANTHLALERSKMLEHNNYSKLENLMDAAGDRVRATPREDMVSAEQQIFGGEMNKMVEKGVFTPDTVVKLRKMHDDKVASGFIDGLMNTRQYGKALNALTANQEDPHAFAEISPDQAVQSGFIDPNEAKSLSEKGEMYKVPTMLQKDKVVLTPEMSVAMNGLSTEKKARLIDQLRGKLREDSDMKLSDLNASISGFEKIAHSPGGEYTPKQKSDILSNINNNSLLTVHARMRAIDKVNTADAVHAQLQVAVSTPRNKWGAVIDGLDARISHGDAEAARYDKRMEEIGSDLAVQANRLESKEQLSKALTRMIETDNKDPVTFNIQNNPDLALQYKGTKDNTPGGYKATQSFVSNSLALQQYRGVPVSKQRVLTNDEVTQFSNLLKVAPDSESANHVLNGLQAKYGGHFPKVIAEISGKDKEFEAYGAAVYANPSMREGLVDAIKNKKVIDAELTKSPAWSDAKKLMNLAINQNLEPFRRAINISTNDASGENVTGKFQTAMELRVKSIISKNHETPIIEATKQAYNEIIGSQYHIASSPNSTVIVPKQLADKRIVESYLKVYSRKENFSDLHLSIPPEHKNPDGYYEFLSKQGRWVTTPDQSGVKLMQVTPSGKMQPVYDTFGSPVIKSYEDINKRPGKKVNDEDKGFMGRLMGG